MGAPQIITIVLLTMGLTIELCHHGQRRSGKHNFWYGLIGCVIASVILWWGGFFS